MTKTCPKCDKPFTLKYPAQLYDKKCAREARLETFRKANKKRRAK